jgi:hypothetical protein
MVRLKVPETEDVVSGDTVKLIAGFTSQLKDCVPLAEPDPVAITVKL